MSDIQRISFFKRLERQILLGKKTATIRDAADSHFCSGLIVDAYIHETEIKICRLLIESVEAVNYNELSQVHAKAENTPLFILKWILRRIYPGEQQLYFIRFSMVKDNV